MSSRPAHAFFAAFVPFLLVTAIYLVPVGGSGIQKNPNELVRIQLTVALLVDHAVHVDSLLGVYGESQDQSVREGKVYSDKAPGVSLLALPAAWAVGPLLPRGEDDMVYPSYWPLRHVLVATVSAIPAVLFTFLLTGVAAGSLAPSQRAWLAALLCLATPMLTYATTLFSHAPAAVLVGSAFLLAGTGIPSAMRAGLGGLLAGLAVTTEYPTLLLAAVLFGVLILRRPVPWRAGAAFTLGLLAGILPMIAYHDAAFGSPFTTGYAFKVDPGHARIIASGASGVSMPTWERLHGVILSASRGLLFYSPLLALAVPGVAARMRRAPREAIGVAAACALYLAFGAGFVDWQGGWCAAARHLLPIVPLLCLAVVWCVDAFGHRVWLAYTLAVLAGVSVCHQLLSLALTPLFPEIFDFPLAQVAVRSLLDGAAMPNLVTQMTGIGALAVFLGWAVAAIVVMVISIRAISPTGPTRWAALVGLAAVMAAAGLQAGLSSRVTSEQEHGRAVLLDRQGYHELAREVDARR